jgi:hypothetical protein
MEGSKRKQEKPIHDPEKIPSIFVVPLRRRAVAAAVRMRTGLL